MVGRWARVNNPLAAPLMAQVVILNNRQTSEARWL
jgi:hypothetical protein